MPNQNSGFRKSVQQARERWSQGKLTIRKIHDEGGTGRVVVHALSDLLDAILKGLFDAIIADLHDEMIHRVAIVLHGGNGRRDVAPYSDIDLMVLY